MLIYTDDWQDVYDDDDIEDAKADITSDENFDENEREWIFNTYWYRGYWDTVDDVTDADLENYRDDYIDEQVNEFFANQNSSYFEEDVKPIIDEIFDNYIVWTNDYKSFYPEFKQSRSGGYLLTKNKREAWDLFDNYNYQFEIHDENGVLKIVGGHHDGKETLWGKMLTKKGEQVYNEWDGYSTDLTETPLGDEIDGMDEYNLYSMLFNSKEYSEDINLANKMGI